MFQQRNMPGNMLPGRAAFRIAESQTRRPRLSGRSRRRPAAAIHRALRPPFLTTPFDISGTNDIFGKS